MASGNDVHCLGSVSKCVVWREIANQTKGYIRDDCFCDIKNNHKVVSKNVSHTHTVFDF